MRDPAGLKRLWLAVVGTALLVPLAVEGRDAPQAPPGSGGSGWIVGELRPFAFGRAPALSHLHQLGWLECTGQPLATEEFPELHDAIRDT